jgi:enamine deaminase RidA (YjgF/YER057c/UK114 family)
MTQRTLISGGSRLEDIVGYSRAVVQGDWCFLAGMTGGDPKTGQVPIELAGQIHNALIKVDRTLSQAGFALSDIVRVTYYVTEPDMHDIVAPLFGEWFGSIRPAVTYLQVSGLAYPELKFEVEVTALRAR